MQQPSPTLIFDFADPLVAGSGVRRLAFTHPERVIVAQSIAEVRPALREVQQATHDGFYAAGMVCYEAAPAFDPALQARPAGPLPLLWFGLFRAPVTLPRVTKQQAAVSGWVADTDRQQYDANIVNIREAIARGDTYQVNYTYRLHFQAYGSAVALYQRLRQRLTADAQARGIQVFYPRLEFCTDNGAMIAFAGAQRMAHAKADLSFVVKPRWNLAELTAADGL